MGYCLPKLNVHFANWPLVVERLQVPQRRPGGLTAGVAADHAATPLPAALALDLVGGRAVLGHAPRHAHPPAVAAEELPIRQAGGTSYGLHPPGEVVSRQ